jgi:type I restriction enzyme S subunit
MDVEQSTVTIDEIKARKPHSISMGPFGSNITTDNFVATGVPVIRGGNLAEGRFNDNNFVFLTEDKADELKSANAEPGDLVFTHRGTLGQVGIIPPAAQFPRYVVSQSQMKLSCDVSKVVPLFVFYFFRSPRGQHQLLANTSTTGVPAIARPLATLRSIRIPLPPLAQQRAIAAILGTLDDKIELNRRMNQTLEAMARAIFKSWFVDFDPVRTKAAGLQPLGMDAQTAAIFPSSFEKSTVGAIPKGWRVANLGDIAENSRRVTSPSGVSPATPYIGLEHMPRKSIALATWGRSEEVTSGKSSFLEGEILFGKLRPYFHKVGVAPLDGVCSTDILVVRAKSPEWYGLVLGHLSSEELVAHADAVSTGTKMPRTNWQDMARYEICLPNPKLAETFASFVKNYITKIRQNIHESRTVASIRDALLPRLISGQIRIKDAEKLVGGRG